ncbi:MAG TPA: hypothetical protein VGM90_32660 [Kofleriaceae bacterium]|jgi:hypothetical protein
MPRKRPADDETHLLNVDLEVRSRKNLAPFAAAMEALGVLALTNARWDDGEYFTNFEVEVYSNGRRIETADAKTRVLADALDALPPTARRLFDTATRRTFDIGIQGERKPVAFSLALSPSTVKRVAALNAEIAVTVYAADRPAIPLEKLGKALAVAKRKSKKR